MGNGDSIYHKQDMCTVIVEILKIAVPTIVSSTAGQLIYLINFVLAGQHENTDKFTGLGIGQAISQCCGILIFLGLNSALSTQLSQAYGQEKLLLCGLFVNQAHILNIILFIPLAALMCNADKILLAFG